MSFLCNINILTQVCFSTGTLRFIWITKSLNRNKSNALTVWLLSCVTSWFIEPNLLSRVKNRQMCFGAVSAFIYQPLNPSCTEDRGRDGSRRVREECCCESLWNVATLCPLTWLKQTLASIIADWNLHWSVEGSNVLVIWPELWWIYAHANAINKVTGGKYHFLLLFSFLGGVQELHVCNKKNNEWRKYRNEWFGKKSLIHLLAKTSPCVWLLAFESVMIYSWATHKLVWRRAVCSCRFCIILRCHPDFCGGAAANMTLLLQPLPDSSGPARCEPNSNDAHKRNNGQTHAAVASELLCRSFIADDKQQGGLPPETVILW